MKRPLLAVLLLASSAQASGTFVAVSTETVSADAESLVSGTTWASTTISPVHALGVLAYGNGIFCAVGAQSLVHSYYSTDGVTWTLGGAVGGGVAAIAYGAGVFSVVGTGFNAISADCATWTNPSTGWTGPTSLVWDSVHSIFIGFLGNTYIATSSDGKTYAGYNVLPANGSFAASCGGTTLAVGNSSNWSLTTDGGSTWVTVHSPVSAWNTAPTGVACSDAAHFTVVNTSGETGYFVNPVSGSTATNGTGITYNSLAMSGIAWNGAEYVAVAPSTTGWAHSVDGHAFTQESTGAVSLAAPSLAVSTVTSASGHVCLLGGGIICGNNP